MLRTENSITQHRLWRQSSDLKTDLAVMGTKVPEHRPTVAGFLQRHPVTDEALPTLFAYSNGVGGKNGSFGPDLGDPAVRTLFVGVLSNGLAAKERYCIHENTVRRPGKASVMRIYLDLDKLEVKEGADTTGVLKRYYQSMEYEDFSAMVEARVAIATDLVKGAFQPLADQLAAEDPECILDFVAEVHAPPNASSDPGYLGNMHIVFPGIVDSESRVRDFSRNYAEASLTSVDGALTALDEAGIIVGKIVDSGVYSKGLRIVGSTRENEPESQLVPYRRNADGRWEPVKDITPSVVERGLITPDPDDEMQSILSDLAAEHQEPGSGLEGNRPGGKSSFLLPAKKIDPVTAEKLREYLEEEIRKAKQDPTHLLHGRDVTWDNLRAFKVRGSGGHGTITANVVSRAPCIVSHRTHKRVSDYSHVVVQRSGFYVFCWDDACVSLKKDGKWSPKRIPLSPALLELELFRDPFSALASAVQTRTWTSMLERLATDVELGTLGNVEPVFRCEKPPSDTSDGEDTNVVFAPFVSYRGAFSLGDERYSALLSIRDLCLTKWGPEGGFRAISHRYLSFDELSTFFGEFSAPKHREIRRNVLRNLESLLGKQGCTLGKAYTYASGFAVHADDLEDADGKEIGKAVITVGYGGKPRIWVADGSCLSELRAGRPCSELRALARREQPAQERQGPAGHKRALSDGSDVSGPEKRPRAEPEEQPMELDDGGLHATGDKAPYELLTAAGLLVEAESFVTAALDACPLGSNGRFLPDLPNLAVDGPGALVIPLLRNGNQPFTRPGCKSWDENHRAAIRLDVVESADLSPCCVDERGAVAGECGLQDPTKLGLNVILRYTAVIKRIFPHYTPAEYRPEVDSVKLPRLKSYKPGPNEPIDPHIARQLFDPACKMSQQYALVDYLSHFLALSNRPEHRKDPHYYYRDNTASYFDYAYKKSMIGTLLQPLEITCSAWKDVMQPMSILSLFNKCERRLVISGSTFVVDGPPVIGDKINLFRGYIARKLVRYNLALLQPYLDHLLYTVCRGVEADYNWLLGFLACTVRGIKCHVYPSICGSQGSGKSRVADPLLEKVIGPQHSRMVAGQAIEEKVLGRFDEDADKKVLTVLDEAGLHGHGHKSRQKFKALVRSSAQVKEGKGTNAVSYTDLQNFIYTTEYSSAVDPEERTEKIFMIDEGRRLIPGDADKDRYAENTDYWNTINATIDHPEFGDNYFTFLWERDVSNFDLHTVRVVSHEHLEMRASNKPVLRQFAQYALDGHCFNLDFKRGIARGGKVVAFLVVAVQAEFKAWYVENIGAEIDDQHKPSGGALVRAFKAEMEIHDKFVHGTVRNNAFRVFTGEMAKPGPQQCVIFDLSKAPIASEQL